ncbi:hypothetical protein [Mesorhizobium sp. CAU 1741]
MTMLERVFFTFGVLTILAATLMTCSEKADAWLPEGEPVRVQA